MVAHNWALLGSAYALACLRPGRDMQSSILEYVYMQPLMGER